MSKNSLTAVFNITIKSSGLSATDYVQIISVPYTGKQTLKVTMETGAYLPAFLRKTIQAAPIPHARYTQGRETVCAVKLV